jgi:hypothetical protein
MALDVPWPCGRVTRARALGQRRVRCMRDQEHGWPYTCRGLVGMGLMHER